MKYVFYVCVCIYIYKMNIIDVYTYIHSFICCWFHNDILTDQKKWKYEIWTHETHFSRFREWTGEHMPSIMSEKHRPEFKLYIAFMEPNPACFCLCAVKPIYWCQTMVFTAGAKQGVQGSQCLDVLNTLKTFREKFIKTGWGRELVIHVISLWTCFWLVR